jgi:hypothetical protein
LFRVKVSGDAAIEAAHAPDATATGEHLGARLRFDNTSRNAPHLRVCVRCQVCLEEAVRGSLPVPHGFRHCVHAL